MIGNTEYYNSADFVLEMRHAQAAHIDGFVLNIAYQEPANERSIPTAFEAAASIGFKLLFSFDYAGNGNWPKDTVIGMINKYKSHPSYFMRGSQPLVSTFEGFKSASEWTDIKRQTNCYFMPSWSSMGAKRAVRTGVTDGLFSWGAWPEGPSKTDMEIDASYLIFLNGSSYMMPVSPWFFTNLPGYNKNWLWRGDSLWHDRWNLVFSLVSQDQWTGEPEYLQIISWNDFGESHYIGPLNSKAYTAFDIGKAPYNYAEGMPHDAWRMLLPFAIDTYKNGIATITEEVFVTWYRLTPASACGTGGTTGNTAAQLQPEMAPGELSQDKIFFSAVLTGILLPRITINGRTEVLKWDDVPYGLVGMYHGSYAYNGRTGKVLLELIDTDGRVFATLPGLDLRNSCSKGITNWNPWVGGVPTTRSVNKAPALSLKDQKCMLGTGREGYKELCEFSCALGYCPPGPCTCTKLGMPELELEPKNVDGYPLPGGDCTYKGLCSHACNYGLCPSQYCTTDASAKDKCVIPPEEPDPSDPESGGGGAGSEACTSGTGEGGLMGLCDFSCGRGYCPQPMCKCTGRGPVITPPVPNSPSGYAAPGVGSEYSGVCNFACSRGYCPQGPCTYTRPPPNSGGGWQVEVPPMDPGSDAYKAITCTNPGIINANDKVDWRCRLTKETP
ncbi:glycosyl hydrolase family 71-domain-containing protein [Stachybotrys elegans]|uniref:Glycosyl hydrolase family 71-domain-containing protein n=1 Tax=Stachybotrys elegans TaxID=80388 RepID=A0A8K0SX79_9HYPO|nr:glycosyl hydrolase family 71-domain-containing protein [Stachybotrys elegans]